MKYEVIFSKDVVKFLRKHPQISQVITLLFGYKPITGKENHFRLRVSKYRFYMKSSKMRSLSMPKADSRSVVYK